VEKPDLRERKKHNSGLKRAVWGLRASQRSIDMPRGDVVDAHKHLLLLLLQSSDESHVNE